jgi:Ca2+-binding EF-hand superfamily protein
LEIRLKNAARHLSPLKLTLGLAFACAVLAAPLAQAAADPKRDAELETRFKAADKDNDGCLTRQEAEAGMPRVAKGFDKIDSAKKGCITVDQIKVFANK